MQKEYMNKQIWNRENVQDLLPGKYIRTVYLTLITSGKLKKQIESVMSE